MCVCVCVNPSTASFHRSKQQQSCGAEVGEGGRRAGKVQKRILAVGEAVPVRPLAVAGSCAGAARRVRNGPQLRSVVPRVVLQHST